MSQTNHPDQSQHNADLNDFDPEVAAAIAGELSRQRDTLEMIASELSLIHI